MFHPLRSLTGKFLLLLLPVSLGFGAVLFWLLSEHNFKDQQKELRYSLETFVALQATTLGQVLWNHDTNSIQTLFRAYSLNSDVDRVFLFDAEGGEIARTSGIGEAPPDPRLTFEQNIYYTDHGQPMLMGRISAMFRDNRLKQERERQQHSNLILLGGLFLLISVTTALISRYTIGKPLERLRRSLDKAANDTREPVIWNSTDELGQVVVAYNSLLARQAAAEEEIHRYQSHLEDLVSQRTKELRQESDMLSTVLKQLGERQAYMRAIFSNASVGIITLDPDGVVIEANQHFCRIIGRDLESWDIDDLAGFIHPEDREDFRQGLKSLADHAPRPYRRELRILSKADEIRWCDLAGTGVTGDGCAFLLSVVVLSDTTLRKEAEDKMALAQRLAEDANRAKNDFLANMSHEIRTPMNAVIGLSQLALQTDLTSRQHDYVQKISDSAHSLLGIINDILDFSKIEAGRMTLDTVAFRLDDILLDLATTAGIKAHEKGLEFVFDVGSDVPEQLIGDPQRLTQILVNLCGNAIKFTPAGEIKTTARVETDEQHRAALSFTVSDTGIGMSDAQKDRLFEAFSQADSSITRRFGGTGLGLAICKTFVEMMGGSIGVESVDSQGTSFRFGIPLHPGPHERPGDSDPARTPRPGDDDEAVLDYRAALARAFGNVGLLNRLLLQFHSRSVDVVPAFEAAWKHKDRDVARCLARTFKTTAATVGANRVHRCADLLESACRTGADDAEMGLLTARLSEALAAAVAVIAGLIAVEAGKTTTGERAADDDDGCHNLCRRIRALLENDDTDSIPLAAELAALAAGTDYSAAAKRIEALAARYEFAGALKAVEDLESLMGNVALP